MKKQGLKLKISLDGIKPITWRRVVVNSDLSLNDMHFVIQSVMPWYDGHLHKFYSKIQTFLMPYEDDFLEEEDADDIKAYENTVIGELLINKGDKLKYEYDFGDSWIHSIVVEDVVPPLEDRRAKFVTGKNMTPPEDCGSIWGYENLKEIMANPKHPEYEEMAEWLGMEEGEIFDPKSLGFDPEEVNEELYGM